jgi:phage baseplate assembly protein W
MNKQFYGIKFPLTDSSERLTFFDLNETKEESIKSMLLHIILTPKGHRLRKPNFGTDLIKYIFEPNEPQTWNLIKEEIRKQIQLYLPEVQFNNINIRQSEENTSIFIEIDYSINVNGTIKENKTIVKI